MKTTEMGTSAHAEEVKYNDIGPGSGGAADKLPPDQLAGRSDPGAGG